MENQTIEDRAEKELEQRRQETAKRRAAEEALRARGRRCFEALMAEGMGLSSVGAGTLTAHFLANVDGAEKMSREKIVEWAHRFRDQYPIIWAQLRIGNMPRFMQFLTVSGIDTKLSQDQYIHDGQVIRSAAA